MVPLLKPLAVSSRKAKVLASSGDFHTTKKQKSSDGSLLFSIQKRLSLHV